MKCKMLGILNILLGFLIFQANLQCMYSGYSYIHDVTDKHENFVFNPQYSDADLFPKFPLSLTILDVEFDYKGQYSSVFKDSEDVIVTKMLHILYIYKIAEPNVLRILISIKLIQISKNLIEAYYILNVDRYGEGRILNASGVLPEKLNLDATFTKFILPIEKITEQLEEIVAEFGVSS